MHARIDESARELLKLFSIIINVVVVVVVVVVVKN